MMVLCIQTNKITMGAVPMIMAANICVYAPVVEAVIENACNPVASVFISGRYMYGV